MLDPDLLARFNWRRGLNMSYLGGVELLAQGTFEAITTIASRD